ncbi:unnamed protein product, partial [Gongylonema pulchrum]|uniref:Uncharacterized protein n=1 Tax=Gongylonema pulchrum TaxID=637853 RepID=A0A183DDZ9_9BILA
MSTSATRKRRKHARHRRPSSEDQDEAIRQADSPKYSDPRKQRQSRKRRKAARRQRKSRQQQQVSGDFDVDKTDEIIKSNKHAKKAPTSLSETEEMQQSGKIAQKNERFKKKSRKRASGKNTEEEATPFVEMRKMNEDSLKKTPGLKKLKKTRRHPQTKEQMEGINNPVADGISSASEKTLNGPVVGSTGSDACRTENGDSKNSSTTGTSSSRTTETAEKKDEEEKT